jgi:hypothetical protein
MTFLIIVIVIIVVVIIVIVIVIVVAVIEFAIEVIAKLCSVLKKRECICSLTTHNLKIDTNEFD